MSQKKSLNHFSLAIKDWKFWAKLIIGSTQLISIVVFMVALSIETNAYAILENLSYFTVQSNLLCGVFFLYSAIFHRHEGKGKFDNSEVGKIVILYLSLTVIIYNLNEMMSINPYHFYDWKFLMSFICKHSVVPILAILYFLFFYNHQNAQSIKVVSQTWVWWMVIGLFAYLIFFSIIGEVALFFKWKPLFYTTKGKPTTFVYPFLDWHIGVGFFKKVPAWAECTIMTAFTLIAAIGLDYLYTLSILKIKKLPYQIKNQNNLDQKKFQI